MILKASGQSSQKELRKGNAKRSQPQEIFICLRSYLRTCDCITRDMRKWEVHEQRRAFYNYLYLFAFLIIVTLVRQNINILKNVHFPNIKKVEYV